MEEVLTPNHILYGRKLTSYNNNNTCEYVFNKDDTSLSKRVRYVETVTNHFWERWRAEYLVSLREYTRVYKRKNESFPKVNDIVLKGN